MQLGQVSKIIPTPEELTIWGNITWITLGVIGLILILRNRKKDK